MEWRILQNDAAAGAGGGKNGELAGAPEGLANGDEVVTRRYEFYKYIGPIDAETGEAMGDAVGAADPDGIHYFGSGVVTYADHFDLATGEFVTVTKDLSTVWVVGEYNGAQMAGFDAAKQIGLIDHVQDGDLNIQYPDRTLVIGGTDPVVITKTGSLPDGMTFDTVTGILSGTPTSAGTFTFTIHSTDAAAGDVTKTYTLKINGAPPAQSMLTTSASPPAGGTTTGDGAYDIGTPVTVTATANSGYTFLNWMEGGTLLSDQPTIRSRWMETMPSLRTSSTRLMSAIR